VVSAFLALQCNAVLGIDEPTRRIDGGSGDAGMSSDGEGTGVDAGDAGDGSTTLPDATPPASDPCGNYATWAGHETCDDGNTDAGDGCSATCQLEPVSITAGLGVCALLANATLKCWGSAQSGRLGLGDHEDRGDEPGEMGDRLSAVDLGSEISIDGIASGSASACALLGGGALKCWGANGYGKLGLGDQRSRGDDPDEMGEALPVVDLGPVGAKLVAVGGEHACAVLKDGNVKCWGRNSSGRLGLGDTEARGDGPGEMGAMLPVVDLGTDRRATHIAAGGLHTCVVLDDGNLKCWGGNYYGQLGVGDRNDRGAEANQMGDALPAVDLGTDRTARAVTAGSFYTCALLDDYSVKCWGSNSHGQLGLGDVAMRGADPSQMGDALPAVDLGTERKATQIAAGSSHVCALLDDSSVKCWGGGFEGQLGQGDQMPRGTAPGQMGDALPRIDLGSGRSARSIAAGNSVSCALLDDGRLKCWGSNERGALGLGDTLNRGDAPEEMGDFLPGVVVAGE
jgi:cysteine-rich repeat protein